MKFSFKKIIDSIKNYDFVVNELTKTQKNYDKTVNELEYTSKISENRQKAIFRLQNQCKQNEDMLILKVKEIKKLKDKVIEKEEQRRANAGKIGGLQKRVNELEEELELTKKSLADTKEMLKDSQNEEKWLRVPLPPVKAPKVRMTTRPQKMKPATRKFMAKEFKR